MFSKMKSEILSSFVLLCLLAPAALPTVSEEEGPVFEFAKQQTQ
jgi:hypothetical protein